MGWFKNLNAMPRLMSGFGVLLVLTLGIGYLGIRNLSQANARVQSLYEKDIAGLIAIQNMEIIKNDLARQDRDAMVVFDDADARNADVKAFRADFVKMRDNLQAAEQGFYTEKGKVAFSDVSNTFAEYEKECTIIGDALDAKNLKGAKDQLHATGPIAAQMSKALDHAREVKEQVAQETFEENNAAYRSARTLIVVLIGIALLLGAILGLVISRGFAVPLKASVSVLERVAEGDLTATLDVDTKDEVGRMAKALNTAVEKLNRTMLDVAGSAANASSSANQLAAASDAIATGAQEQAASLEETSASLEEISAAVRNSADNARKASELACGSGVGSEHARDTISAVAAMAEISAASAKISEIISTVDEIAFQTNLLAVNAAVEAARAGEEGRGFAVVASEVRSLAQRSSGAAKEIKTLIQDSLRKVERGSELVNRVTQLVSEIAHTSAEQSTGIEQVNTAMTQMDHVTQSNSAQTEELSATAESLSEQAAHLMELIETFTLDRAGKSAREPRPIQSRLASLHRGEATAFAIHPGAGPMAASRQAKRPSRTAVRKSATNAPPLVAAVEHAGSAPVDLNFEEF